MNETERMVDNAVARLARGRRAPPTARAELKEHLLEAVAASAGPGPATPEHVERAVAGLGGTDVVRATFFPAAPRARVLPASMAVLGGVFLLMVALAATASDAATCSAEDGGSCSVSVRGAGADVAMMVAPPALALLAMLFLPAWAGAAIGAAYAGLLLIWHVQSPDAGVRSLLAALGGLATLAVTLEHLWRSRRAA